MIDAFGDPGQGADIAPRIAAAHLAAVGDQHHPERIAGVEAVPDQCAVAGFEHPQRQILIGQQHRFQRKHRQLKGFRQSFNINHLQFQFSHQRVDDRSQVAVMLLGHPALPLV